MGKRIIAIVVGVAIAAGFMWYRSRQADDVDARMAATHVKLMALCDGAKDSDKHGAFIDQNADAARQHALQVAYTPAGRRSPPKFDGAKYASAFCENLLKRAELEKGGDQLSFFLRQLSIDVENAAKAGQFD